MTAYTEAPARSAAGIATSWVPPSSPPWNAMKPNGERSSTSSVTSGWASSSAKRTVVRWCGLMPSPPAQRVLGRDFDDRDAHAVRILDPHLVESPRLALWRAEHGDAGVREHAVRGLQTPNLPPH